MPFDFQRLEVMPFDFQRPEVMPFDFQRPEVMPFDFQRPEVMPFDFQRQEVMPFDFQRQEVMPFSTRGKKHAGHFFSQNHFYILLMQFFITRTQKISQWVHLSVIIWQTESRWQFVRSKTSFTFPYYSREKWNSSSFVCGVMVVGICHSVSVLLNKLHRINHEFYIFNTKTSAFSQITPTTSHPKSFAQWFHKLTFLRVYTLHGASPGVTQPFCIRVNKCERCVVPSKHLKSENPLLRNMQCLSWGSHHRTITWSDKLSNTHVWFNKASRNFGFTATLMFKRTNHSLQLICNCLSKCTWNGGARFELLSNHREDDSPRAKHQQMWFIEAFAISQDCQKTTNW